MIETCANKIIDTLNSEEDAQNLDRTVLLSTRLAVLGRVQKLHGKGLLVAGGA